MELSSTECLRIDMASLGQILSRMFFWFHDKPQSGAPVSPGQVQFISKEGNRLTYRVDARILAPPTRLALQNDLHTALQEALPELHTGNFSIANIRPLRDDQGAVMAYQVEVRH